MADRARALFAEARLGFPPIPASLEPELRELGRWHFGTRRSALPYDYRSHVANAKRPNAPDSLVLGHGGHGVNSYAIGYYLVFGHVRLSLQLEWGGVYMDEVATAARVRRVFATIERHLPALESTRATGTLRGVAYSDLYSEETLTDDELDAAIARLAA